MVIGTFTIKSGGRTKRRECREQGTATSIICVPHKENNPPYRVASASWRPRMLLNLCGLDPILKAARNPYGCGFQVLEVLRQESALGTWIYSRLMQSLLFACGAGTAKPSNLQAHNLNLKSVHRGDLLFQSLKGLRCKFQNFAALKAGKMKMVPLGPHLVVMLLAAQVHQIKFINHAQFLEQVNGAIDGRAVDIWILLAGMAQKLCRVQMRSRALDGLNQDSPLRCQTYSFGFYLTQ